MADPIPATDPALLAAQARAGQAGVDAYRAAQNELVNQRQSAVQQAMQEAALRGAPAGAMQSLQSTMTSPYDQRIASLEQGNAAYQADLSARDRRLTDYNAAVGAARSYIPQQAELVAAPIRAEGEYRVRGIEMEGRQRVSAIEAERRLTEAKYQAAAIADAIKAAKDAAKEAAAAGELNKTELESLLSTEGLARLNTSAAAIRERVAANAAAARGEIETTNAPARNEAVAASQSASYIAKGLAEQAGRATAANSPNLQPSNVQGPYLNPADRRNAATQLVQGPYLTPAARRAAQKLAARQAALGLVSGTAAGASPIYGSADTMARQAATSRQYGTADTYARQAAQARTQPPIYGSADALAGRATQARQQAAQIAATRSAVDRTPGQIASAAKGQVRSLQSRAGALAGQQTTATNEIIGRHSSPYGFLTADELAYFNPLDQSLVANAPGAFYTPEDVDRYLLGTPGQYGLSHPYAAQSLRDAMGVVGDELREQGLDFSYPEFLNATGSAEQYRPGMSAYDLNQTALGQMTGEEEWRLASQEQADQLESRRRALSDERGAISNAREDLRFDRYDAEWRATHDPETGAPLPSAASQRSTESAKDAETQDYWASWFADPSNLGMVPPARFGTPEQAAKLVGTDQFQTAATEISGSQAFTDKGYLTPDEMDDALFRLKVTSPGVKEMLRLYYQGEEE